MQHAGAARGAFFRPDATFFEDAYESCIKTGVNRLMAIAFGNGLNAGAAAERKDSIISFDRLGGGLNENVVALAFNR
jgi:hypothetical protein